MSAYLYNHQEKKKSGVLFPAMLTQKNNADYKLLSAQDIAWNVTLKNGEPINTTDDLLDYITSVEETIPDISHATFYRINCSISTCYEGDTFDNVPITVIKTVDGVDDTLTYNEVLENNIIPLVTCEDSATCIIQYDSTNQRVHGTAVAGRHSLVLKSGDNVVASHTITVLLKPDRLYSTTIYTESDELPDTPTTCYFEDGVLVPPTGWTEDLTSLVGNKQIWFSVGTVNINDNSCTWSAPCMYITSLDFDDPKSYTSYGVAVYKSIATKQLVDGSIVDITPTVPTPVGGNYEFSNNTFTAPTGWSVSPELAANEYKSSTTNDSLKSSYKTYVSYNNYTTSYDGSIYGNVTSTGWTTPVEYINISGILDTATANASAITTDAVNAARADINESLGTFSESISGQIDSITEDVNKILATVGNFTEVSAVVDSLTVLYTWQLVETLPSGAEATIVTDVTTLKELQESKKYNSKDWFNKYVKLGDNYYKYTATSAELTTKLSQLENTVSANGEELTTVKNTVNNMTPDYIRLLASEGYLSEVTWTAVDSTIYGFAEDKHEVTELPVTRYSDTNNTGYQFGHYYKLTKGGKSTYYRCDYPISTGFLNILKDNISLGVALSIKGSTISSTINMAVGEDGSTIEATAKDIILNGDVIASAIAAKDLNINNTTYLKSTGEVLFAQGKSGASAFYPDGHGSLSGGKVSWDTAGNLSVKGKITATSGFIGDESAGWSITTLNGTLPAMYALDSATNQELYITPQYIRSNKKGETSSNWMISRDGSAQFANSNVVFNSDGSGYVGKHNNSTGKTDGIIITKDGNVTIEGATVKVNASDVLQLGATIEKTVNDKVEDPTFTGLIIDAVSEQINIVGTLNTEDVSVGNDSCFFKGEHSSKNVIGITYPEGSLGAGHVANGTIRWDKDGNLTLKGKYDILASTATYGNNSIYKIYEIVTSGKSGWSNGRPDDGRYTSNGHYLPGSKNDLIYNIPLLKLRESEDITQDGTFRNWTYYTENPVYTEKDPSFSNGNPAGITKQDIVVFRNIGIEAYNTTNDVNLTGSDTIEKDSYINKILTSKMFLDYCNEKPVEKPVYLSNGAIDNKYVLDRISFLDMYEYLNLNERPEYYKYLHVEDFYGGSITKYNDGSDYLTPPDKYKDGFFNLPDPKDYNGRTYEINIQIGEKSGTDYLKFLILLYLCGRQGSMPSLINSVSSKTEFEYVMGETGGSKFHSEIFDPVGSIGKGFPFININTTNVNHRWIKFLGNKKDDECSFNPSEDTNYYYIGLNVSVHLNVLNNMLNDNLSTDNAITSMMKAYNIPLFRKNEGGSGYYLDNKDDEGTLNPVCILDRYLGIPLNDNQKLTVLMGALIISRGTCSNDGHTKTKDLTLYNSRYLLENLVYPEDITYTSLKFLNDLQGAFGGLYLCLSPIGLNKIANGNNTVLKLKATAKQFKNNIYGWVINSVDFIPSFRFMCYPIPTLSFKDTSYKYIIDDVELSDGSTNTSTSFNITYKEWDDESFNKKIYDKLNKYAGVSLYSIPSNEQVES